MDIRKLQRAIVDGLEDVKAQDILVFNTEHLSPLFERVIIASGTSNRQTKALSSSVRESVKAAGFDVPRCEGEDNGEWIIVDCGAAVCHIMQPAIRDYYRLEEIWGGKPVKMKLGDAKTGLVKASEGSDAPVKKKAPVKKASATARSAAGQAALEKPAKPAKAAKAAKPAPARKVTSGGLASAKAAPKKAAPKKAATRSTSGTVAKAPARKSATAKTPMKLVVVKPAAKKTAARKAAPKKTGR
ncbi:ribosome silencing factor [Ideonella sp. 4Y16]|uniref:Ribosomal silencing factor RsfS n=1 Tax=Ideonella alba TaxID=2824118 RepID=A0A940YIA5_9BURK|nr:ribosome silencing factor [Ideonella alba]MBQ0932937.1 ribosome silencing factor [Ideonella alba]MBQ0942656.1 ribosome silencing factor [Ideonella alba]